MAEGQTVAISGSGASLGFLAAASSVVGYNAALHIFAMAIG